MFLGLIISVLILPILWMVSSFFPKMIGSLMVSSLIILILINPETESFMNNFLIDNLSFYLMILSSLLGSMILHSSSKLSVSKSVIISSSVVIAWCFFLTDSIMWFFILFELSLLPLMLLLLLWGRQNERLMATKFMLMYTILASVPLFIWMLSSTSFSSSFSFNLVESGNNFSVYSYFAMLAFFVKIPLFYFHSWLPKAHVEAPLEGSMILAGLMLKVGVFGLIRLISVINLSSSMTLFFLSWSLIGSVMCMIVAMSVDDMKMSVAFSSISHMNIAVGSIFSMKSLGIMSSLLIMISHGLTSPLLFFFVTKLYDYSHSRSTLINKGSASIFPVVSFIGFMIWVMNISPPPLMSFIGEWASILSISSISLWFSPMICFFFVFSSFYSIFNYGVQNHSNNSFFDKSSKSDLMSLKILLSMVIILLVLMFVLIPKELS